MPSRGPKAPRSVSNVAVQSVRAETAHPETLGRERLQILRWPLAFTDSGNSPPTGAIRNRQLLLIRY